MFKNRLQLIGFLGADPEVKFTPTGEKFTVFRLATTEYMGKDAQGQKKEHTEWHQVIVWGKKGEFAAEYLKKGSHVEVEGPLRSRTYKKDNVEHRAWFVKADSVLKLDRAPSQEEPHQGEGEGFADDLPI